MPNFDARGVSVYYEEKGNGEPVVLVHGTLCDSTFWKPLTDAIPPGFRTIAYSRRYAYPNAREGDLTDSTVQNNAEDLDAIVEGLAGGKVHLIGHSYGGFISAYYAVHHPEKLRSLTLANAAVATMLLSKETATAKLALLLRYPRVASSANRFQKVTRATLKALAGGDQGATYRMFLPALVNGRTDHIPDPGSFEKTVARNARTVKETTTGFPAVTKAETDALKVPTMVMWGDQSAPWDTKISQMLADTIPGSERAVISGSGHFFPLEKPKDTNEKIVGFLQRHKAT